MKHLRFNLWIFIYLCDFCLVLSDFDPFSDNIMYNLNWPGPIADSDPQVSAGHTNLVVVSSQFVVHVWL